MAVGTGFLGNDTGGLADAERQLIVGGERHDQDLTGLELGSLGCIAADADFAPALRLPIPTPASRLSPTMDLNHVGSTGNANRNTGGDNDQIAVLDQTSALGIFNRHADQLMAEWA